MRELKFRAYDKVEKEMLTILEMDWYPDYTHMLRYLKAIDKDGKERYYDSSDDIRENLTIEQSTGGYLFEGKKRQLISHYWVDSAAGELDLIAQQWKDDNNA